MTDATKFAGWVRRLADAMATALGSGPADSRHADSADRLYRRLQSLRGRTRGEADDYKRLGDAIAAMPDDGDSLAKLAFETLPMIALLAIEASVESRLTEAGLPFNVSFASIRKSEERFKAQGLFQPDQLLSIARNDAFDDPEGAKVLDLHVRTLFSALQTGGGAPSPAPSPAPTPTTENTNMSAIPETTQAFREHWKSIFAFAPFGLPAALRSDAGQDAYIRAVADAVDLLKVENGGRLAAILIGSLLADGRHDPKAPDFYATMLDKHGQLARVSGAVSPDAGDLDSVPDPNKSPLVFDLYLRALERLVERAPGKRIFFQQIASAGEKASRQPEVAADELAFNQLVDEGAQAYASGGGNGASLGRIELPPLGDGGGSGSEWEPPNIITAGKIYVGLQLEQMGFFKSVDRTVDLFMAGLLPLPYDESSRLLDEQYWSRGDRLSPERRANLFSRVLGAPGGSNDGLVAPNAEFGPCLMRFVTSLHRVFTEVDYLRPFSDLQEYVRKAGRDLAANVSLYCWAGTHFEAERLAHQINDGLKILGLPSVKAAYGVTTPWQVIERVMQQEFGTMVNVGKQRTLADETRAILEIIAKYPMAWGDSYGDLLTIDYGRTGAQFLNGGEAPAVRSGAINQADTERLRRAAQYWLAVNGVKDQVVDEYSEPTDMMASPSLPYASGRDDAAGLNGAAAIRDMVGSGRMPSMDELRSAFHIAV
ncbi:MAG: hypothetical protein ACXW3O_00515 [Brevundimonas sp.]